MARTMWAEQAKAVAKRYTANCREWEKLQKMSTRQLREQPLHPVVVRCLKEAGADAGAYIMKMRARRLIELRREIRAVQFACSKMQTRPECEQMVQLWQIVYIKKTHFLQGAAMQIGISYRTAQRYHAKILFWIAEGMGLINLQEI